MSITHCYSPSEIEDLLICFSPLVRATAFRYKGRGAEYEDLVQEGYMALMRLIPMCTDREWLPAFLKSRLPGYVRAGAERLRGKETSAPDEGFEDFVPDDRSGEERSEVELREMLARALTADELDLTQALMEGFTQKELAALLDISQQAVGGRIGRIRDKLEPLVRRY